MMDKKLKLILIILAFVLLIVGASGLYNRLGESFAPEQLAVAETAPAQPEGTAPERVRVPDFVVYDVSGNEVKLSDYFGKPIVLNFWASWCGPCKKEMPHFNEKSQELEGQVQFLMINMTDGYRETMQSASAFIEEQGYTFPVFYDTASIAAYMYNVYTLPTTYFIDAEGHAVVGTTSAISADALQRGIDMIYAP